MAASTDKTNKPLIPRGVDDRPVDKYNRAELYSGKALDFDGVNDWVSVADSAVVASEFQSIGNNNSYTLCAYFKTTNPGTSTGWVRSSNTIFELRQEVAAGKVPFNFGVNGGKLTFARNDTAGSVSNVYKNSGSVDVATGHYFFGVAVIDNDNVKLYINGALDLDDTITTSTGDCSVGTTTSNFFIGSRATDSGETSDLFDGQIANTKVFNTALTAAQVADLYNNPEKIVPTGVSDSALKLWLPMQESAGTTAYDGSGNGNHGTISGATYVNGIGAPVSQTAVIDWNKGTNIVPYSEELDEWTTQILTISQSAATAPDGSTNAYDLNDSNSGQYGICFPSSAISMSGDYVGSVFIKKTTGSITNYPGLDIAQKGTYLIIDTTNGTSVESGSGTNYSDVTITSYNNDWWRVSAKINHSNTARPMRLWPAISLNGTSISASATGSATFWGAQVEASDSLGAYIPNHTNAAITSPVLLPQGLTSGRDITGVNLFENVRKQGALNLDGNSWAEVHDNESLDFGTGSFTLEAWAKVKYVAQGSSYNIIMSMGLNISNAYSVGMLVNQQLEPIFIYNNTGTAESARTEGEWVHIVGTYDETSATIYVNGVQKDQDVRTTVDTTNPWVKHIGRDTTSVRFYNDQIAQPRIYNRALTASEVLNNYNATSSLYI